MTRQPIIEAAGLVKAYGSKRVVDRIDLRCGAGTVLGLLGPNGAGKTTTLRMLYGFIDPDEGDIRYQGRSFFEHRTELKRSIGVCTQDDTLDPDFNVLQNLSVYASYFRPPVEDLDARVEQLLDTFELRGFEGYGPDQLSGGYRKRLLIARSIIHRPRVLFLDEPTTGLDPRARVDVWDLIDGMRGQGMAIVLTTHYMDEAERLSDELVVLSAGRSVARGTPGKVLGDLLGEHIVVVPAASEARQDIVAWAEQVRGRPPARVLRELRIPVTGAELADFSSQFGDSSFEVRQPTLDDLFLELSVPAEDRSARPSETTEAAS